MLFVVTSCAYTMRRARGRGPVYWLALHAITFQRSSYTKIAIFSVTINPWYRCFVVSLRVVGEKVVTDRRKDRQTHLQTEYRNPRCACAPEQDDSEAITTSLSVHRLLGQHPSLTIRAVETGIRLSRLPACDQAQHHQDPAAIAADSGTVSALLTLLSPFSSATAEYIHPRRSTRSSSLFATFNAEKKKVQ